WEPPARSGWVEELLAGDLVVLDGEEPDLVHLRPLPARLVRDVEDEAHGEAVLVREGSLHLGAVNDVVLCPVLALGLDGVEPLGPLLPAGRGSRFHAHGVLGVQLLQTGVVLALLAERYVLLSNLLRGHGASFASDARISGVACTRN